MTRIWRVTRPTELRADRVEFDERARRFVTDSVSYDARLNIIANKKQIGDPSSSPTKRPSSGQQTVAPARQAVHG